MPQARGTQSVFAIYDETTYATNPGTPAGQKLHLTKTGVKASQPLIRSDTLNADRAVNEPIRGNVDVSDAIEMEIGAESIGKLLKHTMGGVSTTGVGPYAHVLTPAALPVGFIFEKDFGANISGAGRFEYFNGCRIASASFSFPKEGHPKATFTLRGAKQTLAAAALDATLDNYGHTPFSAFEAAIQEGGAAIATVTEATINVDNDLDGDGYVIGGNGARVQLPEGFCLVTGTVSTLFADVGLFTKAVNNTESSLQLTLSRGDGLGSAGNESIVWLVNQLKYERTSPPIEGPRGVMATFSFQSYRKASTLPLTITLKNAVATL